MAIHPFAVLQILGFADQLAVGHNLAAAFHLGDAVLIAGDVFMADEFIFFKFHRAVRIKTGRGEIVIHHALLFRLPQDNALAAILPVVDGMQRADRLSIERPFSARHVDNRFFFGGIFKFTFPRFAEERFEHAEFCGQFLLRIYSIGQTQQ